MFDPPSVFLGVAIGAMLSWLAYEWIARSEKRRT